MKALSLYQHRDSIIHKIDPISKLYYIGAAVVIPIILPTVNIAFTCMLASIILLIVGKVFKKVIPLVSFSFIVLLSIIIIQGLFNKTNNTIFISIGSLTFYKEGLIYAFKICMRVINIICAFSILVLTSKPSDIIEILVRNGLSPRIGYVLSSVLQIIPQMVSTMDTIKDAQRSRGMETDGSLLVRIKAFIPLIGPVVMNSLISTRERAMALEVRGFNSKTKKSFLNKAFSYKYSTAIKITIIFLLALAVIWRIIA
ncbi:energy-coupling factor transporter transmembrane component T family protein [Clostridium magnum]|uniref:Energy-coupling factor transporter transmembrane protein EcfT n=1 Tax=Clostridium magnum DSM 2767 TaxID=1121326 RepID=A0A161Y3J4_9CLOT|nr:energy-coupling factor transporter transmembrane component T [Clostridium magnum]KZL92619.1 energy-coupling factor transporter transmembrane protein EcfT [Clostridium magnum DSM 2767]SHJ07187.1 energy-coupling factor transport system permease protein [Clostridium magnum DSM 2767]